MPPEIILSYHLVLFADVLGQRARLREIRSIPTSKAEHLATARLLAETIGVVGGIREAFANFFESASNESDFARTQPEPVRSMMREISECGVKNTFFSDTTIVSVPLADDPENCRPMSGVLNAIGAAAHMQLSSIAANSPLRGGIDVGLAVNIGDHEIYGPVLEQAYYLESNVADYPRIVVGQQLLEYLQSVGAMPEASPRVEIAKLFAGSCLSMLTEDQDGEFMIDFLGPEVKRFQANTYSPELLSLAFHNVRRQLEEWRHQGNEKLAQRYQRLQDYFESRRDVWGVRDH